MAEKVDYEKLRKDAEYARGQCWATGEVPPSTVLALLDELDKHKEWHRLVKVEYDKMSAAREKDFDELDSLREMADEAWRLIANASGGDWQRESDEWQKAAERWRDDRYHPSLDAARTTESESSVGQEL